MTRDEDAPCSADELALFRAGDERSFRRLVSPHLDLLRTRALRWIGARLQKKISAADIVQDALLIAFEQRQNFVCEHPASFRNWLLGIIDNSARRVIEHFEGTQKRAPLREMSGDFIESEHAGSDPALSPSHLMIAAEERDLLAIARSALSSSDRMILTLAYDRGMPLKEIATCQDRSYDAVKRQHARALLRLGREYYRLKGKSHD